jgi:hypothetical protein
MRIISLILFATLFCSSVFAQDAAKIDRATQEKFQEIVGEMSAAMRTEDESDVRRLVQQATQLLGNQSGLPESPDEYRSVPAEARLLTVNEITTGFDAYIPYIERRKWWRIGLDPLKTNHSLWCVAGAIDRGTQSWAMGRSAQCPSGLSLHHDSGTCSAGRSDTR